MNMPENASPQLDTPITSKRKSGKITSWNSMKGALRFAVLVTSAAAILSVPIGSHVLAKTSHSAAAQENSEVDPAAMDALNKMGTYLRTLKAF
jgi:hypothetical protein